MNNIFRGDLYYADLEPVIGSEQNAVRPVLIVQNNIGNFFSPTVLVAPITSKIENKAKLPTHVIIDADGKIKVDSIILLEQIRVIDKQRLKSFLGKIQNEKMEEVDNSICIALGLKNNERRTK